jgi:hypothetical protein
LYLQKYLEPIMEFDVDNLVEGLEIQDSSINGRNGLIIFLHAAGARPFEIARRFSMSEEGVRDILKRPAIRSEISRITNELGRELAKQRLLGLSNKAITQIANLMTVADSDAVKLRASQDVLDRAGFARNTEPEKEKEHSVKDLIDYLEAKETAEQKRIAEEATVDAEYSAVGDGEQGQAI